MILLLILDCGVFSDVFITHHLWFNFWQVICSFLKIKCTVYCEMGWLSLLRVTKPSSKLVLHMQVYLQPSVAWSGLGGLSGLEVGLGRPRAASSGLEVGLEVGLEADFNDLGGLEVGLKMTSMASAGNMGLFSKEIASRCEIWVYWLSQLPLIRLVCFCIVWWCWWNALRQDNCLFVSHCFQNIKLVHFYST